jgi:hypothetical protein
MLRFKVKKLFIVLIFISLAGCKKAQVVENNSLVNSSHLNHLYEEINNEGKTLGIIHIYSEYPDYHFVDAEGEGTACIDDVARALIFYIKDFEYNANSESLRKSKLLVNYILYMEAEDSTYYNFIFENGEINKTFRTSVSGFQWWMWRALWALSESYQTIKSDDEILASEILISLNKGFSKTIEHYKPSNLTDSENGITFPNWLPGESGIDQTAILIIALSSYYKISKSDDVLKLINELSNSVLDVQLGSNDDYPYGAFLSWRNVWHAWGNSQSYSLLKAYQITKNENHLNSALQEINGFYEYLIKNKYYNEVFYKQNNDFIENVSVSKYPQIAYGMRPMIFACLEAYKITNDEKYAIQAGKIAQWFWGNNDLGKGLYDKESGVCFDGISSGDNLNMNSGAESTIEALLSLIEIEQNQISQKTLMEYIIKTK